MQPQVSELLQQASSQLPTVVAFAGLTIGAWLMKKTYNFVRGGCKIGISAGKVMAMCSTLFVLSVVSLLGVGVYRVHAGLALSNGYEDFILAAHRTHDPVKAAKYIDLAVKFLDDNDMNDGYTSVVYISHDEDAAETYSALKAVQNSFSDPKHAYAGKHADEERAAMWWKQALEDLNLVDVSGSKPKAITPPGLSIHPHSGTVTLAGLLSSIMTMLSGLGTGLAGRAKWSAVV